MIRNAPPAIPMPALAPVERPLLLLAADTGRGVVLDDASALVGEEVVCELDELGVPCVDEVDEVSGDERLSVGVVELELELAPPTDCMLAVLVGNGVVLDEEVGTGTTTAGGREEVELAVEEVLGRTSDGVGVTVDVAIAGEKLTQV
jgi:hypothetical protein